MYKLLLEMVECKSLERGGVHNNLYLIEIPKISDEMLLGKFLPRRDKLLSSLETNSLPSKCTDEETWNGMKCQKYCEVRELCPYIKGEN